MKQETYEKLKEIKDLLGEVEMGDLMEVTDQTSDRITTCYRDLSRELMIADHQGTEQD